MRRWSSCLLVLILVAVAPAVKAFAQSTTLVAGGLTALPTSTFGPNVLQNGGFETVSGSVPTGWTNGTSWAPDQLVKHAGTFSYRRGSGAPSSSQGVTLLKKGLYRLSGWVKTEALTGTNAGVRLQLDFRVGGINDWTSTDLISGTSDWKFVELGPIAVNSDRKAAVLLENFNNPTGTAWFDDVKLEQILPQPVEVFLLYPNYRGMLFDDQSQTMKMDVTVTPPGGDMTRYTVRATLADETSATVVASRSYAATANFVADLDGSAMRSGAAYLLKVSLVDEVTSAAVYTYPAYRVSRVPAAVRASMNIAFDAKNRVLLHGTPRFVLGVYDSGAPYGNNDAFWENQLWSATGERRMSGLNINMYLNYWYGQADAVSMKSLMANLDKHGVMYLQTGNCFSSSPAVSPTNNFAIDISDPYVQDIGSVRGSAGYYTIDECTAKMVPGAFAQYQRLKRLDPDSMTFAALLNNPPDVFLWRDAADMLSTDPYPLFAAEPASGYNHKQVADWTVATREAVKSSRPFMTVLQFFKFTSLGRWPTRQEMRNHAYMAIVEGARGLWWWSLGDNALRNVCSGWCAEKTQHMDDLKAVVNEIAALEPALIADDTAGALAGSSNTAIRTKVKVVGGKGYVFAYNTTNAGATVTFGWNVAPGTVTVNGENRTLAASGSSFTDTFGPYQAHVYVIANGGTGGTPPPTGTPTVTFTNPQANATVSGTATVTMSASGGSGAGYVYALAVDGTTVYSGTNGTFSWNTTTVANGTHTLTASVTDSASHTGTASRTVTVSNTAPPAAPTVTFTAPAANATVSGTTTVTMSASGGSGTGYTYTLAVDVTALPSNTSGSFSWNTTTVSNGTHTLTATVKDSAGASRSATRTVTVSNTTTPPTGTLKAAITAPTANATVKGTAWAVLWVNGASGTSNTYTLSMAGKTLATSTTASTGPVSLPYNTTLVADGAQTLAAAVKDATGKTGTASVAITVSNGTTPPPSTGLTAGFTSPAAGATLSGTVTVGMTVSGSTATSRTFKLMVDSTVVSTQTVAGTTASAAVNTVSVPNGSHTLSLTVTDSAGKTGSATRTVTVSNVTGTGLTAGFTSPAAGATISGTVTVGMTVSGSTATSRTFKLMLDSAVVSTQTVTGSTASLALNTTAVANGSHTLTLTVTDSAGKAGSATRTVTVSNTTPPPTGTLKVVITAPLAGATVRGTAWAVVWVEGAATGSKTYTLSVNGVTKNTQVTTSSGPVSMPWATTVADNGGKTITVTVKDSAGKTGTATRAVTVAN